VNDYDATLQTFDGMPLRMLAPGGPHCHRPKGTAAYRRAKRHAQHATDNAVRAAVDGAIEQHRRRLPALLPETP
jgi:hypothetical protein